MLAEPERQCLLVAARTAIESAVIGRRAPPPSSDVPALMIPAGAFVTLHKSHELRGCIGYLDAKKPLIETVHDAAVKSAVEDPRFPPVTTDELGDIYIEISVLSPMTAIRSAAEIVAGIHGLVVEFQDHRGLLLPQVAAEFGWDAETLLQQTIRKAGLLPGVMQEKDLRLFVFTAEVFGEHRIALA